MIKLRDAKCPNCGANIQVNEKLENTICQYCGSQVIIEEAIEKYKIELSGKVEVEGIKGRTSKLSQAKKHIVLEEYEQAKKILLELVDEDSFDIEAYIELIKIYIEDMDKREFNETSSKISDRESWQLIDEIVNNYERIKKIDDNNIVDNGLKEQMEKVNYYVQLKNKTLEEEVELKKMVDKLNDYYNQVSHISTDCASSWMKGILGEQFENSGLKTSFAAFVGNNGNRYTDEYSFNSFVNITRDGILESKYYNVTKVYSSNPQYVDLHRTDATTVSSIEEIKQKMAIIEQLTEQYISKSTDIRNNEIDKANKRLDRENNAKNAKNKILQIRIYIDYAIMAILGLITFISIFTDGIGFAIMLGILLDSWVFKICIEKIKDHKWNMEQNSRDIQHNNLFKNEHV